MTCRRSAVSGVGPAKTTSVRDRLCTRSQRTNGFQEFETSAKRKTHLAEMILREIVQDIGVDRVLAEYRLVPFETKAPQPTSDVHVVAQLRLVCMIVEAEQSVEGALLSNGPHSMRIQSKHDPPHVNPISRRGMPFCNRVAGCTAHPRSPSGSKPESTLSAIMSAGQLRTLRRTRLCRRGAMYGRRPRCKGKESDLSRNDTGAAMYSASKCSRCGCT